MTDLKKMTTETRNSASETLDCMNSLEIVTLMNLEDEKIASLPSAAEGAVMEALSLLSAQRGLLG